MTYYVKANSKKDLNERLANGEEIMGTSYSPFGDKRTFISDMPKGTTIKIFSKYVSGSPYAKAYGTWNGKTVK